MYWLHTDETNTELSQSKFFIYGGLIATPDQMKDAHERVVNIRSKYGFAHTDEFKFNTRSRPEHIAFADWTAAKSEAIQAVGDVGIRMLVYLVNHGVAKGKTEEDKLTWAMNALFAHFGLRFLSQMDSHGAISIDRLPPSYSHSHLESLFINGVTVGSREVKIPRVIHYSVTSVGASHINSLVDITLGAFRFCVNVASESGGNADKAAEIMSSICKIMWSKANGEDQGRIRDYGLILYPKEVRAPQIKAEYDALVTNLNKLVNGKPI
ncbi:hypothetical protein [Mycobacterium paraintracellulare]|uniref:hypothetical protein n=1 Tax=Mycobacterium paraintracellulare TaxID=1138383 RepID=UPI00389206AB